VQDRDAGTKILATRHDTHDQDLADGINATLEKSGSNAATGNLDIGSNRITLVADGTAKTDAATVNQIQSNAPAFQATDTGTANAYVIALSPAITAYAAGQAITFKAANASTTASTLNVNTLGTKVLKKKNDQDIASGDIEASQIVAAVYDGTSFQVTSQLASEALASSITGDSVIINGAHVIDQRSADTRTGLGASDFYISDRWQVEGGGSPSARWDASIETSGGPVGADRWLKLLNQTADASPGSSEYQAVKQGIESFNCTPLVDASNGKVAAFTISGQLIAHSSSSFPLKLPLVVSTQTGTQRQYVEDISITADATWQSFSVTVPADATASFTESTAKGLVIGFGLVGGSGRQAADGSWETFGSDWVTSNSHNWAAATGEYIGFTDIKCEPGSVATAYIEPDYGTTFALCQRYYYRRTGGGGGAGDQIGLAYYYGTAAGRIVLQHPVEMRAAPTFTRKDTTITQFRHGGLTVVAGTGPGAGGGDPGTFAIGIAEGVSGTPFTLGQVGVWEFVADGDYFEISAEL
jgi:hypothetical protein